VTRIQACSSLFGPHAKMVNYSLKSFRLPTLSVVVFCSLWWALFATLDGTRRRSWISVRSSMLTIIFIFFCLMYSMFSMYMFLCSEEQIFQYL
jgi:hypothetical protein